MSVPFYPGDDVWNKLKSGSFRNKWSMGKEAEHIIREYYKIIDEYLALKENESKKEAE